MLPLAPLSKWIAERRTHYDKLSSFAFACGTAERRLSVLESGIETLSPKKGGGHHYVRTISLSTADRLLTSEGSTFLTDVWPWLGSSDAWRLTTAELIMRHYVASFVAYVGLLHGVDMDDVTLASFTCSKCAGEGFVTRPWASLTRTDKEVDCPDCGGDGVGELSVGMAA